MYDLQTKRYYDDYITGQQSKYWSAINYCWHTPRNRPTPFTIQNVSCRTSKAMLGGIIGSNNTCKTHVWIMYWYGLVCGCAFGCRCVCWNGVGSAGLRWGICEYVCLILFNCLFKQNTRHFHCPNARLYCLSGLICSVVMSHLYKNWKRCILSVTTCRVPLHILYIC